MTTSLALQMSATVFQCNLVFLLVGPIKQIHEISSNNDESEYIEKT